MLVEKVRVNTNSTKNYPHKNYPVPYKLSIRAYIIHSGL